MRNPKLGASILSISPFLLLEKIKRFYLAGIDYFHLDIMDGNFVPNLSLSPFFYEEMFRILPHAIYDLHFMVTEKALSNLLPSFLKNPPHYVTLHQEAILDWKKVSYLVRDKGAKFGLALNPTTSIDSIKDHLQNLDMILIMSVVPGHGGQKFIDEAFDKIQSLHNIRERDHLNFLIQVDGGITLPLAKKLINLGADMIVIGSDLANATDPASYIQNFSTR